MAPPKATGWRIPLIFCAGVLAIGFLCFLIMPPKAQPPELPQTLLEKAGRITIDLDQPGSKVWKDAIVDAASGFAQPEAKDAKLAGIVAKAQAQNHYEAVCAAIVQIKNDDLRDKLLSDFLHEAMKTCATLPWGVFAVYGMKQAESAQNAAVELKQKWLQCEKQ